MAYAEPAHSRFEYIHKIPSRLRALMRRDEIGLIGLGLLAGAACGRLRLRNPRRLAPPAPNCFSGASN